MKPSSLCTETGLLLLLACSSVLLSSAKYHDIPCEWKSLSGAHYDLKPLMLSPGMASFEIKDGDIPCTPEEEPAYSYVWNFCGEVPYEDVPDACRLRNKTHAVALQYAWYDTWSDCHVVGRYNAQNDDLSYAMLDSRDPTKGVSISYPSGEKCSSGALRTTTLDVQCANTKSNILSAQEPNVCQYHFVMQSYHGCPTECPVTSNGLCNSHGHCSYDSKLKTPYCYCNEGYSGSACTDTSGTNGTFDGNLWQTRMMKALLAITILLVGVISFMIYKVIALRKEQAEESSVQFAQRGGRTKLMSQSSHGGSSSNF